MDGLNWTHAAAAAVGAAGAVMLSHATAAKPAVDAPKCKKMKNLPPAHDGR